MGVTGKEDDTKDSNLEVAPKKVSTGRSSARQTNNAVKTPQHPAFLNASVSFGSSNRTETTTDTTLVHGGTGKLRTHNIRLNRARPPGARRQAGRGLGYLATVRDRRGGPEVRCMSGALFMGNRRHSAARCLKNKSKLPGSQHVKHRAGECSHAPGGSWLRFRGLPLSLQHQCSSSMASVECGLAERGGRAGCRQ